MNTTEEKNAIEVKESTQKDAYIVCEEATCKCSAGMSGVYSALKVTSQNKVYINDTNLVATIDDNKFDVSVAPFKKCNNSTKQGQPCEYIPKNKWEMKVGDEHPLVNGKKVLTQNAIMKCKMGGEIEIVTHGQTIDASNNEEDIIDDSSILYSINCLIDKIEVPEEKIEVVSIKHILYKDTKSTKKLEEITLRGKINQEFTAFTDDTKEAQYTYWYVRPVENVKKDIKYDEKIGTVIKQLGNKFSIKFFHEGKYLIEGFGRIKNSNGVKKSSISKDCAFLVNVSNVITLKEIEILPSAVKTGSEDYEIIRNEHYTIKLKTNVDELLPEEIDSIKIEIKDDSFRLVNFENSSSQIYKQLSIPFSAPNEGYYLLLATFLNQTKQIKLLSVDNQINKVITDIQDDKIRPNTTVIFTAQMKKNDNPNCYWYIKKDEEDYVEMCDDSGNNGKFGKIPHIFNRIGTYSIKAELRQLFGSKKAEYKKIVVKNNVVNSISSSTVSYVGNTVKFSLNNEFSDLLENENVEWQVTYNPQEGGESIPNKKIIEIVSSGARFSNTPDFSSGKLNIRYVDPASKELELIFNRIGNYTISAKINDTDYCSPFEININKSHIIYWDFADKNGTKINKLGWGRDFSIMFAINGLTSSKVDLKIWHDKGKYTQKEREEGKMDYNDAFDLISEKEYEGNVMSDGTCIISINSASFWEKLTDGRHDRKIFFTINAHTTICDNWSSGMYEKLGQIFPQASTGTYLTIPKNSESFKMYFTDGEEVELKQIISFNSVAKFVAYFYNNKSQKDNFDKYKFRIQLYENLKGNDKLVWTSEESNLNSEGKVIWDIPVSDLKDKSSISKSEFQPHFYYVDVERKNEDSEKWKEPITYPENYQKGKKNDTNIIMFEKDDYIAEDVVVERVIEGIEKENKQNFIELRINQIYNISRNPYSAIEGATVYPKPDFKSIEHDPDLTYIDPQTGEFKIRTKEEVEKLKGDREKKAKEEELKKKKEDNKKAKPTKEDKEKEEEQKKQIEAQKAKDTEVAQQKNKEASDINESNLRENKNYILQLKIADNADRQASRYLRTAKKIDIDIESKKTQRKFGKCYCYRDFTENEVKDMVKVITGKEDIWTLVKYPDFDKSYESLTKFLNESLRKHGINRCIQKMAFLAMVAAETGFFQVTGEIAGTESASRNYKGRGILQLTGGKNSPGMYDNYKKDLYKRYGEDSTKYDVVSNPDLVAKDLFLAIDSGCWFFKNKPTNAFSLKNYSENSAEYRATKWRQEYYGDVVLRGTYLTEVANWMAIDEYKYFYLICRTCHGYGVTATDEKEVYQTYNGETIEILRLQDRLDALDKLKVWFKYDKGICREYYLHTGSGRAPWMEIVVREAMDYGGHNELAEPLYSRIRNYYYPDGSVAKTANPSNTHWCACFASYCLKKTGFGEKGNSNSQYFRDDYKNNVLKMKRVDKLIYGAIIVWRNEGTTDSGHVAFLLGTTPTGNYLALGGNQGSTIKISERRKAGGDGGGQEIMGLFVPSNYVLKSSDELTEDEKNYTGDSLNLILLNNNNSNATDSSDTRTTN